MAGQENEKGGKERRTEKGRSVAKWYTRVMYFDEEGIEIDARVAKRDYIILNKRKHVKIDGITGTIEWWCRCGKNPQQRIF